MHAYYPSAIVHLHLMEQLRTVKVACTLFLTQMTLLIMDTEREREREREMEREKK